MYLEFVNLAERRCSDGLSAVVEIQENVVDAHSEIKIGHIENNSNARSHGEYIGMESLFPQPLLTVKLTHPLS